MITVSTTSPAEARLAASALRDGLPAGMPWSVYLNGKLHDERPGGLQAAEWPPQAEER